MLSIVRMLPPRPNQPKATAIGLAFVSQILNNGLTEWDPLNGIEKKKAIENKPSLVGVQSPSPPILMRDYLK